MERPICVDGQVVQDDEIEREVLELSGKPAVVTFATRAFLKQLVSTFNLDRVIRYRNKIL